MSSDHEENAEAVDVKSDLDTSGSVVRGTKPRRRRRGKRRKHGREIGGDSETNPQDCDSDEEDLPEHYPASSFAGCKLRPLNVPKAPENSTQFLIDDHNECRLYMSFETPNPYTSGAPHSEEDEDREIVEPEGEDAAYIDINYEYESPQDFDNSAYHDMEFEIAYKSTRFEELLRLPRAELIRGIEVLETKLKELSDDLLKETNPSPVLNKLQHEFLELQEKHFELKECNARLRSLVEQETGELPEVEVEETEPMQFVMDPEDPPVSSTADIPLEENTDCDTASHSIPDKSSSLPDELSENSHTDTKMTSNVPETTCDLDSNIKTSQSISLENSEIKTEEEPETDNEVSHAHSLP